MIKSFISDFGFLWLGVKLFVFGILILILGFVGGKLLFRKNGLPRNPAKSENGHNTTLAWLQTAVSGLVLILMDRKEQLKPAIITFEKKWAPRRTSL